MADLLKIPTNCKISEISNTLFNVKNINSIQTKYPTIRQDSKGCTFALQYKGTAKTLQVNNGFSLAESNSIVENYKKLYKVSEAYTESKLEQASSQGYITAAFGLRVRTPLLHQVVRGTSRTPYQAEAEGRTAGNALSQSWGLLNNRAASEFMTKVRSEDFSINIRPCAHIHDAQYYIIKDDIDLLHWVNKHVVQACEWQDHPDISHDIVKLGGELSVFYPDWSNEIPIKNNATPDEIVSTVSKALK